MASEVDSKVQVESDVPVNTSESSSAVDHSLSGSASIGGIFGTSRCGSTWLGAILDSHPDLVYRFEPFSRAKQNPAARKLRTIVESDVEEGSWKKLYYTLLDANPSVDKPPFFKKTFNLKLKPGRKFLWAAAKRVPGFSPIYKLFYTPSENPAIVFKEVNKERYMSTLIDDFNVPVVYLMRHPCGVTWSHLKGQEIGVMLSNREDDLQQRLDEHHPGLLDEIGIQYEDLTKPQKRALLWRISVEDGLKHTEKKSVIPIVYENLCHDPLPGVRQVFEHFGLSVPEQTEEFLKESSQESMMSRIKHGEMSNAYFSVFRNSSEMANKWCDQMPKEWWPDIKKVIESSPAYQFGLEHGNWVEL